MEFFWSFAGGKSITLQTLSRSRETTENMFTANRGCFVRNWYISRTRARIRVYIQGELSLARSLEIRYMHAFCNSLGSQQVCVAMNATTTSTLLWLSKSRQVAKETDNVQFNSATAIAVGEWAHQKAKLLARALVKEYVTLIMLKRL